jgi:hypothetical protein
MISNGAGSRSRDVSGLVDAVLAHHDDPATQQFEAALAAAVDAGLSRPLERALRYWHRQSVANIRHYAASAVPAVLDAVGEAQAQSIESTVRARTAAQSFARDIPDFTGVITLTDPSADDESADQLESRRRTVAARLTSL